MYPQTVPTPMAPQTSTAPTATTGQPEGEGQEFIVVFMLSFFLGIFGIDRFYTGKIGTGVLKLITCGGVGIWWVVDLIRILNGSFKNKQGQLLSRRDEHRKLAKVLAITYIVIIVLYAVAAGLIIMLSSSKAKNQNDMADWFNNNQTAYNNSVTNIQTDVDAINADTTASLMQSDCQQLKDDAAQAAALPAMPDSKANGYYHTYLNDLTNFSSACIMAAQNGATTLPSSVTSSLKSADTANKNLQDQLTTDGLILY